jgi:hypothetical protein
MTIELAAMLTFGLVSATAFCLASLQRWANVDWWIVPFNITLLLLLQVALTDYGPFTSFMQFYELEIHCSIVLMPMFYYAMIGCDYVALARIRRSDLRKRFAELGPGANIFGNPLRPWSWLTYSLYQDASSRLNRLGHQVERRAAGHERLKATRQFAKLARENYAELCRKRSQHAYLNEHGMLEDGPWAKDARNFIVDVALPHIHPWNQRLPLTVEELASLLNELIIPAGSAPEPEEQLPIEEARDVEEPEEQVATLLRAAG